MGDRAITSLFCCNTKIFCGVKYIPHGASIRTEAPIVLHRLRTPCLLPEDPALPSSSVLPLPDPDCHELLVRASLSSAHSGEHHEKLN